MEQRLILSELLISKRFLLGVSCCWRVTTRVCCGTNAKPVCATYSFLVIVSARFPFRPPPRFNNTDSAFPPTNQCSLIRSPLLVYPPIFGVIFAGKCPRTPLMLLFYPSISSRTLVGINGVFSPWDNSSNLLKM